MALLLHHPASPQSRKVRILMGEKKMLFVLREEEPWRPSDDVYKLNPAGELPIFINDGVTICGGYAITEYLEEINQEAKLIFGTPYEKAEIRRLSEWFDCKFYRDVFKNVADEKIYGDKENIDIDGEVIKGYRTRLVIDSKNRDRVAENFINTLKANDEFISVLAKMRGVRASDIRSSLDNYLNNLKDELQRHNKLEISLYVNNKTKAFIKAEAVSELGNISFTSEGDNKYSYIISKTSGGTLATGEFAFTVNKNKTKYTYNLYYKKTKDDEVLTESNFDLKYTSKQASNFDRVDVSNSIDLNNMSDIEKIGIYTKIMADSNLSKFLPVIRKVV